MSNREHVVPVVRLVLSLCSLLVFTTTAHAQDRVGAALVEIGSLGDARHQPRLVTAYVPAHLEGRSLPVLYVNDGQAAFTMFRVHRALDALIGSGTIDPWVVVAIDTTDDRSRELAYDPEHYADFVADVVRPAVEARIQVRPGPSNTAILGYSYGGLAAIRAQLHRPEVFGRVIAMSPSLWVRQRVSIDRFQRSRSPLPTRMWIDVGSLEGRPNEVVPYLVADARTLCSAAIARGMHFGETLGYFEAPGEEHDMFAAGRRMETALAFALSDNDLRPRAPRSLEIQRYPVPSRQGRGRGARRAASVQGAFAIQASYEGALRLTWPAALAREGGAETAAASDIIRAHVSGVTASSP